MKRILRSLTWTLVEGSIKGTRLNFSRDQIDLRTARFWFFSLLFFVLEEKVRLTGEKERKNLKVRILGKYSPNFILTFEAREYF